MVKVPRFCHFCKSAECEVHYFVWAHHFGRLPFLCLFMERLVCPSSLERPRFALRRWSPEHAPLLKATLDANLSHLRPFLPWAWKEPSTLAVLEERLAGWKERFDAGEEYLFGLFAPGESEVWGAVGIHRRGGEQVLELGYWLSQSITGQGLMTEAVGLLTSVCVHHLGARRVQICCDAQNAPSSAVAKRLGYRLSNVFEEDFGGWQRTAMVWSIEAPAVPPLYHVVQ